ncbi:MAG: hypothetical protein KAY08_01260, partial [Giesbergeria sp.]|nr:hypothetical protein [Giesbergeria sp.]
MAIMRWRHGLVALQLGPCNRTLPDGAKAVADPQWPGPKNASAPVFAQNSLVRPFFPSSNPLYNNGDFSMRILTNRIALAAL